jgi:hypothetical protein
MNPEHGILSLLKARRKVQYILFVQCLVMRAYVERISPYFCIVKRRISFTLEQSLQVLLRFFS